MVLVYGYYDKLANITAVVGLVINVNTQISKL